MGILSGSRREIPLFFIAIIVFAVVAEGYLDNYLWFVIIPLIVILFFYMRSSYNKQITQ
jgi:hypothetical protein